MMAGVRETSSPPAGPGLPPRFASVRAARAVSSRRAGTSSVLLELKRASKANRRPKGKSNWSALVGLNDPMPDPLRHEPPVFRFHEVASWLSEHAAGRGRILVDEPSLAALLAVTTALDILGPLGERGSPSQGADPSTLLASSPGRDAVHAYLERYAVGWVVLGGKLGPLDSEDPVLEAPLDVAGFRVRRVAREPSFFAEGTGRIDRTGAGVIGVRDAVGPRVTIRFHHDSRFRCRPDCRVERALVAGDAAGFLSVPSPPPAFEVYVP
jgi:hypothetical protein